MSINIIKVTNKDRDILYKLLQYALYDGSMYIDNTIDMNGNFKYEWFDNYFTDDDRDAYLIKDNDEYIGMVMVNENLKFNENGKCIAEFLILPKYRRKHIGSKVATQIFEKYKGDWEVEPMENNPGAYAFWKYTINEYTKGKYIVKKHGIMDVFIFNNGGKYENNRI